MENQTKVEVTSVEIIYDLRKNSPYTRPLTISSKNLTNEVRASKLNKIKFVCFVQAATHHLATTLWDNYRSQTLQMVLE